MTRRHRSIAFLAGLVGLLCLVHGSPALAGPAEDYAEGTKRYTAGDLIAAMPPLRKAADAGHAAAQALLAEILQQADEGPEAITYYRKAALQGNADGQFGLGSMLAVGEGAPKDIKEARKWITLAAEQGHKLAIHELAFAYINGNLDINEAERQGTQALHWIRAAADNGYVTAMERMAAAYRSGDFGLDVDIKTADEWTEKTRKALGLKQQRRKNR